MIPLEDLEAMDRVALLAAWSQVFRSPAPRGISQAFLRRFLAFEIQCRRSGGVPKNVLSALRRPASATKAKEKSPQLKPGGRLVREWNGVTHIIDVTEDGFVWKRTVWRSLSAIAREITGAHWSGPRFFGLSGKTDS